MSNIIPLPNARSAAARADLFVRIGEAQYTQLALLHAEGRLKPRRAILDASRLRHTADFAKTLRDDGVELTLDTKAAELAALTKYAGHAAKAPWAHGTLHLPRQFDAQRRQVLVEKIAEVAIAGGFDRVLSPSHYLKGGVSDPWFDIDIQLCQALRTALDSAGGSHIAIDYPRDHRAVSFARRGHPGRSDRPSGRPTFREPDLRRADHFIDKEMAEIDRASRQIKELKPMLSELQPKKNQTVEQACESLSKRMTAHAIRNEKMRASLEHLHNLRGPDAPRAAPAQFAGRLRRAATPRSSQP